MVEIEHGDIRQIELVKYRWVILVCFCLIAIVNYMQFLQYTIVSNVAVKYYQTDNLTVVATGLVFYIVFIVFCIPISYIIETHNIKTSAIISIFTTLLGSVAKIFSNDPSRIYAVLIGQSMCAIGSVYILSMPTKVASTWFGAEEVSTASAIEILSIQLGIAIGAVIPPFFINSDESDEEISNNIRNINIFYSVISAAILALTLLIFRSKPKNPPSLSQISQLVHPDEESFYVHCKKMFKNKDFLILLFTFGFFNGLWNSFGLLANTLYTYYFPDGETDVGIITLAAIFAGCLGCFVFGFALDKTHQFKKISLGVAFATFLSFLGMTASVVLSSRVASFITLPIFGFFATTGNVLGVEYALEVTYPLPESASCSVINATGYFFGILVTLVIEGFIDSIGYTYSFVTVGISYIICSIGLFFASNNLRRRQANLSNNNED